MQKYIAACLIIFALLFLYQGCSIGVNKFRLMIKQDIQEAFKDSIIEYGKR
jgi:hypothetical protein